MIVDSFEEVMTAMISKPTASVVPIPPVHGDKPEFQEMSETGKKTLWVVFVLMVIASAGFTALSWRVPLNKRLFHTITTMITIFASLSYFAMATGHGISTKVTTIRHQNDHVPDTYTEVHRQVFWARYVDWSLTTPLLLLDLGLLAGMSGGHIFMAIVADIIMVLTGLFAAYGEEGTGQLWGWYTIACIAYLFVIWHLAVNGGANATAKGPKVRGFFVSIAAYTLILWTAYPIVWGLADGSRMVGVDGEVIAYAILDVLAKAVFGAWLLVTHSNMRESDVDLNGFWANGLGQEGAVRLGED